MSNKILALDSSTTSTGYSVFENDSLVSYGVIDLKSIENTEKRITKMINSIYALCTDVKPDVVVTELTVVVRNAQAQRNLTIILGAVFGFCCAHNIRYSSLRPTEWRKLISEEKKPRKREELKIWSKRKVEELFDVRKINDDISDAILLGLAYIRKNAK